MSIKPPDFVIKSEEQYDKPFDVSIAKRLWGYVAPMKLKVLIALGYMTIATAASVAGPTFLKLAIDEGMSVGDQGRLLTWVLHSSSNLSVTCQA